MIQPSDIEALDNKKVVLYDIFDCVSNISDKVLTEKEKLSIEKLNKEVNDIIGENKLTFSTDIGRINNKLKDEAQW